MAMVLAAVLLTMQAAAVKIPSAVFVEGYSNAFEAKAWRVDAEGRVERIPGDFETTGGDIDTGTTDPVPSPDQRRLAFVRAGQIHVRDLETGRERPVTALDDPQSRFRLSITAWSPDSSTLLYHVRPPIPPPSEDDDCGGPFDGDNPREFRLFDLSSGEDRLLEVPTRHGVLAWLPDGSLLLEDLATREHPWMTWKPGESTTQRLGAFGSCGPVVARGSERLLAACLDDDLGRGRIFSIRLSDGSFEAVTPAKAWGDLWWPSLSASGRMAFIQSRHAAGGDIDLARLIVDHRPVFSCPANLARPVWIGDEAVALRCKDELIVVAAADGEVLSRTPLP